MLQVLPIYHAMGSEDFAFFSDKVPCCYIAHGAMFGEGYPPLSEHNPKVRYNENMLPVAVGSYCTIAAKWLESRA